VSVSVCVYVCVRSCVCMCVCVCVCVCMRASHLLTIAGPHADGIGVVIVETVRA
jgi:hypothetical protein